MENIFGLFTVVFMILKVLVFIIYAVVRYKLYILSFKLPGPIGLPVFGNLPSFLLKKGTFFKRANAIITENKETFRFWIGTKLLVIIRKPEYVEQILTSAETCKDDVRSFVKGYNIEKNGNDEKWRAHKKDLKLLMNPIFFTDNIEIFQKHATFCMAKLEEHANQEAFDIYKYLSLSFVDIFGELILGDNVGAQSGKNEEFVESIEKMNNHSNKKIVFSCFHLGLLFRCTKYYREARAAKEVQNYFIENIITKSWERRKFDVYGENSTGNIIKIIPIVDKIGEYVQRNQTSINKDDFREYVKTLFISSEKTLSLLTAFCCLCFGMYPEYQSKASEEMKDILGDRNAHVKYEDLNKLKYLDMCVKDVIRLVTLRPFIVRRFTKTVKLDNLSIPSQCNVVIPLYVLNRDPKLFEKPEEFYPDHFHPDEVKSKHCSFTFGAGARDCMGKSITTLGVKIMLVNILRRYRIEADGKFADLQLKADPFTTPTKGFSVRLIKKIRSS